MTLRAHAVCTDLFGTNQSVTPPQMCCLPPITLDTDLSFGHCDPVEMQSSPHKTAVQYCGFVRSAEGSVQFLHTSTKEEHSYQKIENISLTQCLSKAYL